VGGCGDRIGGDGIQLDSIVVMGNLSVRPKAVGVANQKKKKQSSRDIWTYRNENFSSFTFLESPNREG